MLVLLAIPAMSLLFLQNRQVQTMVTKYLAGEISEKLQAKVSLSSVSYSFFKRIQVRDLYLEDQYGDTLIYSELTKVRIKQIRPDKRRIEIKKITVENAQLNLFIDSSSVVNLSFFIDLLKNPHAPPERKNMLHIASIEMIDGHFSLKRVSDKQVPDRVDYNNLHLDQLQIRVDDLISLRDTVSMQIRSLAGIEKSGFIIGELASSLSIGKRHMHFTNVEIETPSSSLSVPVIGFDFEHWKRFKTFSKEVDLVFHSKQSSLNMTDLAYFIPLNIDYIEEVELVGYAEGKLSDLQGDELFITFDGKSTLAFDFIMIGLPDINSTFIDFNFKELHSSMGAIKGFFDHLRSNPGPVPYPWSNLENLDFQGKFTGYPDNFVATGFLATNLGDMIMDLSFKPDSIQGLDFRGRLNTRDFKLGAFLNQNELLASLDMDVMTEGNLHGGQIRANLEGSIDTLDFYRYAYSNIQLDGEFTNSTFDGGFTITDPNIKMDFLGRMDFSGEVPAYNFTANVARARPYYLKLVPEEPNSFVSFLIETNLTGRTLDELNGNIRLVNSLLERKDAQLQLYDMDISTRNTADTSWVRISSGLFDASIEGKYRLSMLPASLKNLADRYMDVAPQQDPAADTLHQLSYRFQFKSMNPLLGFFVPSLKIGERSELHGQFDPSRNLFTANGFLSELQIGKNGWSNVEIFSETSDEQFSLHFQSDSLTLGGNYSLVEQQFSLLAARDTAAMNISWDNRVEPRYSGMINLEGSFFEDSANQRGFLVNVNPAVLMIDNEPWQVGSSKALIRKGYLKIDSLTLMSSYKYLIADGVISSRTDQDFNLTLQNLELSQLTGLTGLNADLAGTITGNINYKQQEDTPYIFSDLRVDTLQFNDQLLGPTSLTAAWNENRNSIKIQLLSELNSVRLVEVDGTYTPRNNALDFDVQLNGFKLSSMNRYIHRIVDELDGKTSVQLTIDGTLKEPQLNGEISLLEGAAKISYLNSRYVLDDQIRVFNNNLYLEDFTVLDELGNRATVNGSISNAYLSDFYLNLNMQVDNLLCMNTTSTDNEVFYGSIFASGSMDITGPINAVKLNIDATTGQNTAIFLPLYTAREVTSSDFITFVSRSEEEEDPYVDYQAQKIAGIEMNMDVNITPDAVVQLIFDPQVGDIIETSGQGNVRMTLDQTNGFRMFGDVELIRGDYLFTLQNVINKRFLIRPGGKIIFNGTPTDAAIDLDAIYTTRTSPYNLYPGDPEDEDLKRRIPVECHLTLQGELQSPSISPGIEMPTADPETRNLLENSTSTEEELMRQFLSLLVINNFYSVSGFGAQYVGVMNSNIAGVTASELLSNQLSNWLSQISDDFDIGVNYRPGDEISSDEVEVALSTQLLNDRILISGNVDVGGQQTNPSSTASGNPYIMGDFDLEFRVTDNVSVIAFNRARDELLLDTAPYKQGVGISYREEFNNLNQLFQRYKEGLTNRKRKKNNPEEAEAVE